MASRREFLKRCCALGAAGATAHMTRLGLMTANAQSTSTYKALVCIFMFGGNDSNNMIVPITKFSDYTGVRGGLAQRFLLGFPQRRCRFLIEAAGIFPVRTEHTAEKCRRYLVMLGIGLLGGFGDRACRHFARERGVACRVAGCQPRGGARA